MYQSPAAATYLIGKLLPVVPIWSVLLPRKHHCNSTAENHFKNTEIENLQTSETGQFLDRLFESFNAANVELNLKEPGENGVTI